MKIRVYVIALLLATGALPLLFFGLLSVSDSKSTTIAEATKANTELARSAAERIADHLAHEEALIAQQAGAISLAPEDRRELLAEAFLLEHPHWHNLTVVSPSGETVAQAPPVDYRRPAIAPTEALKGVAQRSKVKEADPNASGPFAHTLTVALPVFVVGSLKGVVLAELDLVGIWEPVNAIRVGKHGFVRLMTHEGVVLAHGHPDDRRDVFAGQHHPAILAAAKRQSTVRNSLGAEVITASADVPNLPWAVVVEQPVSEAHAAANAMRTRLLVLIGVAALLSILVGLWAARGLVRGLEAMEAHTKTLATGDLTVVLDTETSIHEVQSLANSIEQMAASLNTLHKEAKAKERVTTFGRVAAGLAHDLRLPVETLSDAAGDLLANPGDEDAAEYFRWTAETQLPRLSGYLDDLQSLASEGDIHLELVKVDLRKLADEVCVELAKRPKWRGVSFVARGSAAPFDADRKLLHRALSNLAGNAADASIGANDARVTISVDQAEDTHTLTVSDNGRGMEPELLEHILSGDFRSTKKSNGIGLGFGVARYIAQSHGGSIAGESEPGAGTTFRMSIRSRITEGRIL